MNLAVRGNDEPMSTSLPQQAKDLLDAATYVTLATLNEDGSPQATVLWAKRDGDDVLLSTTQGRRKARNMERDPRVSLVLLDAANPYTFVEIRGSVTMTTEGGTELIDELSHKYTGGSYTRDEGTNNVRVVVRLTPEHVTGQ